jgi:hypothetical protein
VGKSGKGEVMWGRVPRPGPPLPHNLTLPAFSHTLFRHLPSRSTTWVFKVNYGFVKGLKVNVNRGPKPCPSTYVLTKRPDDGCVELKHVALNYSYNKFDVFYGKKSAFIYI